MGDEQDKLMDLFNEALARSTPEERDAYLTEACGGDVALRRQVEALLQSHTEAGEFLKPPSDDPPEGEQPGTVIGRYKLLQLIGEGGFGRVYMAEQVEPIRRKVALKIIKLGMDTKEVVARFEVERQALALMDHPDIARVHDGGATPSGRPYFVMELVKGIPITDYCDQQNLPTEERLELFVRVCHAVQHAHQKGVIHRDLKPSNILVTEQDGEAVPKVIDFGVAKAIGQPLTDKTLFTRFEQLIGTPTYISPEQAGLGSLDVDTRTDVYALGVLLYELLTSTTPVLRDALHQAALDEIRRMIRETEPPKPSTRLQTLGVKLSEVAERRHTEPSALAKLVRGDLDWIVMKCLEKDRRQRYDTAEALAQDVERYRKHEPVSASPPSTTYRIRKFVRRHRHGVVVATVIVASLWLGLLLATAGLIRASRDRNRAVAAETQAKAVLRRTDLQRARELFNRNRAAEGVALLALLLREDPNDYPTAEWLLNELTQRSFPLPTTEPLRHDDIVKAARFSPDGKRLVTVSRNNSAQLWDAITGAPLSPPLRHDQTLVRSDQFLEGDHPLYAGFSPNGERVVTASVDHTARIWDARDGQPLTPPLVHPDWVTWARFTPDGEAILTACVDGFLRRWAADTGAPLGQPFGKPEWEHVCDLSADGRLLLIESRGKGAEVWDVNSGTAIGEPPPFRGEVRGGAFSPDGKRVVTGWADYTFRLCDSRTGKPLCPPLRHDYIVTSVQFSPDGLVVATASHDKTARLWNGHTGEPIGQPLRHDDSVCSVRFSPEGQRVVTASYDRTARVWDVRTGEPLGEPMQHQGFVWWAEFSPDGHCVATASADRTAQIWDARSGEALGREIPFPNAVSRVQWSPDGRRIFTINHGQVTLRNAATGLPLQDAALEQEKRVRHARFSPDGARLVTASAEGTARVWDAVTGQALTRPMRHQASVLDAVFSSDGRRVVTASADFIARLWDAQTGEATSAPLVHQDAVLAATFSPDGSRVGTASADRHARLWDSRSGRLVAPAMPHQDQVVSVEFSRDGLRLVTASRDHTARVWDARSGAPLAPGLQHNGPVHYAAFSPNGLWVVTASADDTARVWDARTGQPICEPLKHEGEVVAAEFDPDGQRVLTASVDGTARVWNVRTGQMVAEPLRHRRKVNAAHFSPDGHWVATASQDYTVRLWEIVRISSPAPAWLPDLAEAVAGLRLNAQRAIEDVPVTTFFALKARLARVSGGRDYEPWARWFLADRSTRLASPSADRTVPEFAATVLEWDPGFALSLARQALRLQPTNGALFAKLTDAINQQRVTDRTQHLASLDWASKRALELSPENSASWKARGRFLEGRGDTQAALQAFAAGARFASSDPGFWEAWGNLLESAGQLEEAYLKLNRAFKIAEAQPGPSRTPSEYFFWRRWGFLRLHETAFKERLSEARFAAFFGVLPREPGIPRQLLDLGPFYHRGLERSWLDLEPYRMDLRELPHGRATLAGVEFDIRGVIQIGSALQQVPSSGSGLPVRLKCRRLHFLHAADVPEVAGTQIGLYRLHYADGQQQEIPIIYGKDVLAWLLESPPDSTGAVVAWRKVHPNGVIQQLYKSTWENPRPGVEIGSLDMVSTMTRSGPFVVAITAEP